MPRVTEVLDYLVEPELLRWMLRTSGKKRAAISEDALRVGSLVDSLIQQDLVEGGYVQPEGDPSALNCLRAWELFKKDHTELVSSVVVADLQKELRKDDIVGHPDLPVVQKTRVGIIDIKCASGIRPRYWTQTAKYLDMYGVSGLKRFIGVLRLDKRDGVYEYREIEDEAYIDYELSVFNAYLLAYNHNFTNRELIRKQLEDETL